MGPLLGAHFFGFRFFLSPKIVIFAYQLLATL